MTDEPALYECEKDDDDGDYCSICGCYIDDDECAFFDRDANQLTCLECLDDE